MNASKFKFDTEFRVEGDQVSLAARARARKTLSQDEIEQMCAKAHAEGAKAGEARALEAIAAGTADAAGAVRHALDHTHNEIEIVRQEAAEIAFAVARKLAAAALDALPAADVELALREAIHQAIGEPRIVLRASKRVVDALSAHIDAIAQEEGFEGRVVVGVDSAIAGADCRIEWRGGGAERNAASIEKDLAALIARRFSHSSFPEE
jgi:flagellar assembly protein FliH